MAVVLSLPLSQRSRFCDTPPGGQTAGCWCATAPPPRRRRHHATDASEPGVPRRNTAASVQGLPPGASQILPAAAPAPLSWFHRHRHRAQQAWVAGANPLAVDAGLEILAGVAMRSTPPSPCRRCSGWSSHRARDRRRCVPHVLRRHRQGALDGRRKPRRARKPTCSWTSTANRCCFSRRCERPLDGRAGGDRHAARGAEEAWRAALEGPLRAGHPRRKPKRFSACPSGWRCSSVKARPFHRPTKDAMPFSRPTASNAAGRGTCSRTPSTRTCCTYIASEGPRALYEGVIAAGIVEAHV